MRVVLYNLSIVEDDQASLEHSSYNRLPFLGDSFANTFQLTWGPESGATIPASVKARALLNGVPQGPWVSQLPPQRYVLTYNAPNGNCLPSIEFDSPFGVDVLAKQWTVNSSGAPLPDQDNWLSTYRFQERYGDLNVRHFKIPYSARVPITYPLKLRAHAPNQALTTDKKQWWVRRVGFHMQHEFTPIWARGLDGTKVVLNAQKYYYNDAVYLNREDDPFEYPSIPLIDGPRSLAMIGHAYSGMKLRGGTRGEYILETSGRLFRRYGDGRIKTLIGPKIKDGELPYHPGMLSQHYPIPSGMTKAQIRAIYDSAWTYEGDLTLAGDLKLREPWKVLMAERIDGAIDIRNGHEGWISDTLNDRIVWFSHWTAHSGAGYGMPHFPPSGYTAPAQPTGQVTVVTAHQFPVGSHPWGMAIDTAEERIYVGLFGSQEVWSFRMDFTDPRLFFRGIAQPTYQQLGASYRLDDINRDQALANQANYVRDGGPGVGSLIRPQDIEFNHDCSELVIAERYTYAIRKINKATRQARTLYMMPNVGGGGTSSATQDIQMVVDAEGLAGPIDDIYFFAWRSGSARHLSINGADYGNHLFQSGAQMGNGPLNLCFSPDYGWLQLLEEGGMQLHGNAAGFQELHVSRRLPSDPDPDWSKWMAGSWLFKTTLGLSHGFAGHARLGFLTMDELGALSDSALLSYWEQHKEIAASTGDWALAGARCSGKELTARNKMVTLGVTTYEAFLYFVRWETRDVDYPVPEDPQVIAELQAQLAAAQSALAQAQTQVDSIQAELDAQSAKVLVLENKIVAYRALVDEAIAADTVADQQEAVRLQGIKAALS